MSPPKKKVWIACGGTGGHFIPGVVVGKRLREQGVDVVYFGEGKKIEEQLIRAQNIEMLRPADAGGRWQRGKNLWKLMRAQPAPDACLLFGGFTSLVLGMYCLTHNLSYRLFEQNALPGRVNRLLSLRAAKIHLSFASASRFFPRWSRRRCVHTGNPVRRLNPSAEVRDIDVLVLGGSQGAAALNRQLPGLLPEEAHVVHICGSGRTGEVHYEQGRPGSVRVLEHVEDVVELAARSRWVVTRSGATTLAELSAVGSATLMVPLPSARDDHQRANARELVEAGAGLMLEESEFSRDPEGVRSHLAEIFKDTNLEAGLRQASLKLSLADIGAERALKEESGML